MTTDVTATIRHVLALDAEATRGPWRVNAQYRGLGDDCGYIYREDSASQLARTTGGLHGRSNAALIAYYRTAAPALADECERLRAENARLDDSILTELENRDTNADWADKLAYAIAPMDVIGEHSNLNNPWANALDAAESLHDECERLRERVAELEEALKHIAIQDNEKDSSLDGCDAHTLLGALRHCGTTARAALEGGK